MIDWWKEQEKKEKKEKKKYIYIYIYKIEAMNALSLIFNLYDAYYL